MQETWVQYLGWEDPLEKEMATHSSIVSWEIPWTEDPSRLRSMGWQRVRLGLATKNNIFIKHTLTQFLHVWRRKWQPTPVFLPRESHGQRSLAGYGPWGLRVRHD